MEIRTYRPINQVKEFTGVLKDYDKDSVSIEFADGEMMKFARADIALIRLAFDF